MEASLNEKKVNILSWLETVSSTYSLMGHYNHYFSLDATIMVSKKLPSHW